MIRRMDEVKNKRMRNIKYVEVLDKKSLRFVFRNNSEIIVEAKVEDFGYDSSLYITKDNKPMDEQQEHVK